MTKLEEMRQAQQKHFEEMQAKMREEDRLIAAEHAKTAEALLKLSERSDSETSRFNKLIRNLTVLGIILAVGSVGGALFFPNGISGVSVLGPRDSSPSEVIVVTPAATTIVPSPSVVPTPSVAATPVERSTP